MLRYILQLSSLVQGMQSRDSCVQREISSSITLLHTGTIKVQVRSEVSSDFVSFLRIFFSKYVTACSEITF